MKCIIYSLLVISTVSCVNLKIFYKDGELYSNSYPIKQIFEKYDAKGKDKSIVAFTGWFEKDTIKIINGGKVVFEEPVKTRQETGFATFWVVSNETKVEILIPNPNGIKITLKQKDLKKYKFVYISRDETKRDKYELEYSNEWKKNM
ncbi:hypothetical protein [Flavobacterium humi]|uniref:Lipoprotein n=1 Tax=Flavobacterium humi TaxID=2562683 RepID=A0A4Z0LDB0_9FLAO|nr:hypothetical protein [Flavobacterium humi]TGD59902.1 hypothetical protein E4635_02930 [Flavobacterium humi]